MARNWDYGGIWRRYDMEGEIRVGTGTVMVHDLWEPLPEFMHEADCQYVDCPWDQGNMNSWNTKAGKAHKPSFPAFYQRVFDCIDEIAPHTLVMQIGKRHLDDFRTEMLRRFEWVSILDTIYFGRGRSFHLQASRHPDFKPLVSDQPIPEEKVIAWLCQTAPFECIGDFCMGLGFVGFYANLYGRRFVGTEMNKKRLAILLERIRQKRLDVLTQPAWL